ncbi:hypothetical protein PVAND_008193 [Polypedilum vanderplanki]|uniref:Uncharacterized protein n=1 Tax=Polypedilum vanderplanki TaxID=319348 RepID=A0A9J6CA83_POLVA|nr:hypothetical protein PVAND_008193 [Polypedilum vanderplanki]
MFRERDSNVRTNVQIHNNGVKKSQHQYQPLYNNNTINQTSNYNNSKQQQQQHQSKSSFIKFFNPFSNNSKSVKSQIICSEEVKQSDGDRLHESKKSVKVLKQFWNDQIKTAKSSENLNCNFKKSATLKYFSQSNDNLIESKYQNTNRAEKSLTLDSNLRLPLDDFNKFKDANFIRNKKNKLLGYNGSECNAHKHQLEPNVIKQQSQQRYQRPESLNDNHFPQVSATGGKLHWAKRDDILLMKKSPTEATKSIIKENVMSVKTNKVNASSNVAVVNGSNGKSLENPENNTNNNIKNNKSKSNEQQKSKSTRSDSMTSSIASSINSNGSSSGTNSASRKFSFKTNPATTSYYMNKKLASSGGSVSKVAQIAQRFNQMIQQDASILEEVKRGGVVVHRSGGRVFKIKEEKASDKNKKSINNDDTAISDDAVSLISIGKNSTRRKSTLRKRPSIRIMVESPRKDGNSNVLSKRQLYEANVLNKETIIIKPKVPDKSERVLAKTKELKNKKTLLNEFQKTEPKNSNNNETTVTNVIFPSSLNGEQLPKIDETIISSGNCEQIKDTTSKNNFRKIYDKITFRSTFLYGKKSSKTTENLQQKSIITTVEDLKATGNNNETEATAESNKPNKDDIAINENELEDDLEFKPIDLNLNVYFNNENLSKNANNFLNIEEKNVTSQGPQITNVTIESSANANSKPDQQQQQAAIDMKPNNSFLFRTQSTSTKFDSACDTFMRGMLNDYSAENTNEPNQLTSAQEQQENDYEIISKDLHESNEKLLKEKEKDEIRRAENGDDIDKNNEASNNTIQQQQEVEENIYQSLCEVKGIENCDAMSDKSYESFENYDEIKQSILDNTINMSNILKNQEDDYIVPLSHEIPPELPAPRKNTIPKISSPILTSTTSNLVQANFSVPKQSACDVRKSNSCISTTYEKIKYDQLPQSKQQHSHSQTNVELPLPPRNIRNNNNIKQQQQNDENIYDTIKNCNSSGDSRSVSTEYENIPDIDSINGSSDENDKNAVSTVLASDKVKMRKESESFNDSDDNPYKNSKNDTMSIISNCYESISLKQSYSTINQILRHAISTTTLSSEHRINSIYGIGQSLTPPSDRSGGSDNSDEWIDVESEDETENNDRFIVICKKTKAHRNPPDWSRLIRQKLDEWDGE